MKGRQNQFDDSEMAIACQQSLAACLAASVFAGGAHSGVKRAMGLRGTIPLEIEEVPVAYFEDALIDNVLARSIRGSGKRAYN